VKTSDQKNILDNSYTTAKKNAIKDEALKGVFKTIEKLNSHLKNNVEVG
jgi:hypothetical protein